MTLAVDQALSELMPDGWLVGGAVRDRLLGRAVSDLDVVVPGEVAARAHTLARALDAHRFELSEGFGAWRVVARDHAWQIDLMPLLGDTLQEDLARRDLTINAIAEPLAGGRLVDPFDGQRDLSARRLRMVGERSFTDDPLRVMRVARQACELGFEVDPETARAARAAAPALEGVSAERVFAELVRVVAADAALAGLGTMETVGATAVVLPELLALRGVEQSDYHHRDVHDHTLLVLSEAIALEQDPSTAFPGLAEEISAFLAEPLTAALSRSDGLRFGALLHDIAKPQTRGVTDTGRVTFMGHDVAGAALGREILGRLRAGERLADHVAALTRYHLRLGFLVHKTPLDRRTIYGYMRGCAPVAVDVSLLSVADRLATRGRNAELAISRHLELAQSVVAEGLRWRADPPHAPVRGDALADALGMRPGPRLGELLRALEEASYAGEVTSAEEAIALARRMVGSES